MTTVYYKGPARDYAQKTTGQQALLRQGMTINTTNP